MQPPERFVNHSCDSNTETIDGSDVAVVDIKKGEEITTNYGDTGKIEFQCCCHSKNCKQK